MSRKKHDDNVRIAPKTIAKAVLNVSSTSCNNERQSFAKLSYGAIDNILTNLLPAGLQDFFQVSTGFKFGLFSGAPSPFSTCST